MLIILDRDGVINYDSENYIRSPEEWHAIPGSLEAIAKLNAAGHTVVIATNQSGIGRGYYNEQTLHAIHEKMQSELKAVHGHIDKIYYCPHHPDKNCNCRKPEPGMLLSIAQDFNAKLNEAVFIGDSSRDIAAAERANCPAILVLTGNGTASVKKIDSQVPVYPNLAAVAEAICKAP